MFSMNSAIVLFFNAYCIWCLRACSCSCRNRDAKLSVAKPILVCCTQHVLQSRRAHARLARLRTGVYPRRRYSAGHGYGRSIDLHAVRVGDSCNFGVMTVNITCMLDWCGSIAAAMRLIEGILPLVFSEGPCGYSGPSILERIF